MNLHRLTLAAVALALLVVPLAPLYCSGDDPAAMACCREQANACNQPGAPDDDCCRDTPADGQTVSAPGAVKVEPLASVHSAVDGGRLVPVAPEDTPFAVRVWWLGLPLDRPPPLLSVLRI